VRDACQECVDRCRTLAGTEPDSIDLRQLPDPTVSADGGRVHAAPDERRMS
jgi:hypothetical protein